MDKSKFCSFCGAGYPAAAAYCQGCGMSVDVKSTFVYTRTHQNHCSQCGKAAKQSDTYCAACGFECNEYTVSQGWQGSQMLNNVMGSAAGKNVAGAAGKIIGDVMSSGVGKSGAMNLQSGLTYIKERSVFMPALVFAVVAVGVGLILSLIIDMQIDRMLRDFLNDTFGRSLVDTILDGGDFRLGAVSVWMITLLSGLGISMNAEVGAGGILDFLDAGLSASFDMSMSLGVLVILIVPGIALFAGKFARNMYINSQCRGKVLQISDGVLGAGMFVVINIILSFFPTAIENTAAGFFETELGMGVDAFSRFSVSSGPMYLNLFLYSLILGFLFAMPGIGTLVEIVRSKFGTWAESIAVAAQCVKLTLLSGAIMAALIVIGSIVIMVAFEGIRDSDIILMTIGVLAAALPNLTVWLSSLPFGGSFTIALAESGDLGLGEIGDITLSAFGASVDGGGSSWVGIILIVAGLWVALAAMHKLLRDDNAPLKKGIIGAALAAIAMWVVSLGAMIAFNLTMTFRAGAIGHGMAESESVGLHVGTASFTNMFWYFVVMAAAAVVIQFSKQNPQLDGILYRLATPKKAGIVLGLASIITFVLVVMAIGI